VCAWLSLYRSLREARLGRVAAASSPGTREGGKVNPASKRYSAKARIRADVTWQGPSRSEGNYLGSAIVGRRCERVFSATRDTRRVCPSTLRGDAPAVRDETKRHPFASHRRTVVYFCLPRLRRLLPSRRTSKSKVSHPGAIAQLPLIPRGNN